MSLGIERIAKKVDPGSFFGGPERNDRDEGAEIGERPGTTARETFFRKCGVAPIVVPVSPDRSESDGSVFRRRLSEKELFLLLLVGIAVMMAVTGFVLIVN
ncbi:hypothetical protein [Natrinema salinisoli]|uniref:hypothetical protein n=1 Tax=Natrinema salinisoli TaxID=2878535 RepID=UPI001CEFC154|nr:hypothetical protein [Natrinema salinisoli]